MSFTAVYPGRCNAGDDPIHPCPPIPARGALGAWHLPNHIRNELEAATSR